MTFEEILDQAIAMLSVVDACPTVPSRSSFISMRSLSKLL